MKCRQMGWFCSEEQRTPAETDTVHSSDVSSLESRTSARPLLCGVVSSATREQSNALCKAQRVIKNHPSISLELVR